MNINTVVHINSVGIISPTTNDLYVFNAEFFATNGADIVDERISDRNTVDLYVCTVFQLDRMLAYRVVDRLAVVFNVDVE